DYGNSIEVGGEVRGYLERQGLNLYITSLNNGDKIEYNGTEVTKKTQITSDKFRINCPTGNKDFEINITLKK
ncbi:MAG TPA: hypothetical protein V6C58_01150, partial [Allocoleopsis sp.]